MPVDVLADTFIIVNGVGPQDVAENSLTRRFLEAVNLFDILDLQDDEIPSRSVSWLEEEDYGF